jgi:hypothetical protein
MTAHQISTVPARSEIYAAFTNGGDNIPTFTTLLSYFPTHTHTPIECPIDPLHLLDYRCPFSQPGGSTSKNGWKSAQGTTPMELVDEITHSISGALPTMNTRELLPFNINGHPANSNYGRSVGTCKVPGIISLYHLSIQPPIWNQTYYESE